MRVDCYGRIWRDTLKSEGFIDGYEQRLGNTRHRTYTRKFFFFKGGPVAEVVDERTNVNFQRLVIKVLDQKRSIDLENNCSKNQENFTERIAIC